MVIVLRVMPPTIEEAWERGAARWIEGAVEREVPPRYSLDDILHELLARQMDLWIAYDRDNRDDPIDAAAVTQVLQFPQLRELRVPWIGGRRLWKWARELDRLITLMARDHGCAVMTGGDRPGWQRFGYENRGVMLQKVLT